MAKEKETKEVKFNMDKNKNFSEWFSEIIQRAELADYTSVSGCMVFRPYSYAMWEIIQHAVDERIKELGVKNAYFPLFIPEQLLSREAAHVKGFSPEVAWVTQAGDTKLNEKLAVRPTSETIMYESYARWIRSWRDLPLKINQWNNVVRWEFKHPVALLRTREFLWNEGHTVFASKEEAEKEMKPIISIYSEVLKDYLALYGIPGRKTEKEKFAGADYTISIELFLPNGKAIQGPDFHHDGQNFAKAFGIQFLNKEGKKEYAWQNTWAITTRMLGVMIAIHGDNKGLVLPPRMAPIQAVIVPILFEDTKEKVLKVAEDIKNKLKDCRIELDSRESYSPGWKFNEWELKGVPIRIEIGPKDVAKKKVILVRRDTGKKQDVRISEIGKKIKSTLEEIQNNLYENSKKFLESSIIKVESWQEFMKAIQNKKMALAPFCGNAECEDWIKDKTQGASSRCIPFEQPKTLKEKCVQCGKPATVMCYFAKAY